MDRNINNPATEATTETAIPAEAQAPAVRTQRAQKARSVEELAEVNPNSMTKTEAVKYIKYLREECETLSRKVNQYEDNISSAFKKVRHYEQAATLIDKIHKEQNSFVISSLRNLMHAIDNTDAVTRVNVSNILKGGHLNAD